MSSSSQRDLVTYQLDQKTLHTWKGHWRIILNTSIMARRRPSSYVPMTQEARFTKESYLYPTDERMAKKL